MIELKRNNGTAILNKSIYTIDETDLNAFSTLTINWGGEVVLCWLVENNTTVNFTNLELTDAVNTHLVHTINPDANSYSVSFSGTQSGAPIDHANTTNLNQLIINWGFIGLATGFIKITIYSIPL